MRLGLGFSSPPPSPKARDPFGKLRAGSGTLGVVENDLGDAGSESERSRLILPTFNRLF